MSTTLPRMEVGVLDVPADDRELVASYFAQFADTRTDDGKVRCPGCGRTLYGSGGLIAQAIGLYSFEWGIAHGEGRCCGCGWPARGRPTVKLGDGRVVSFPVPLPYHPSVVEMPASGGECAVAAQNHKPEKGR